LNPVSRFSSRFRFRLPNARLQPQAARTVRIEHDARIEGAPTVGCEPWLDSPYELLTDPIR
jgi:hypothetical protein